MRAGESPRRIALEIAAVFALFGFVWMVITNIALHTLGHDRALAASLDSTLDWAFVLLAAATIYVVSHRAASKLARARSVLSAVLESIGDGLLVYGRNRRIVHANPAAVDMLGARDEEELCGMSVQQFAQRYRVAYPTGGLVSPDAFTSQRAFDEEGAFHYKAVLHPSPERDLVFLSTAAGVRTHPGQRPDLVVSVMHDITDSDHLERLRDRFFMAAAHALKTPIAIIKANIQLTERTTPVPDRPSLLAIERQCDRIDRLVQNLQIVSRARSRSLELYLHDMDMAPLVLETARELERLRWARAVRVDVTAALHVYGDRERLATVVRNLCHEALQSSIPKSTLTLRMHRQGSKLELAVGYEPLPVPERTFAGSESYDDTALSRAATETVVTAHGGEVGDDDSSPDEATRWIRLPLMEEHDEPADGRADRG